MKQDDRHGLSESAARVLAHRVLDSSQADHARVNIASGRRAFIRSADNRITTAGASDNTTVTITSVFGRRIASVTTNALDRDGLADAVRRSEALARLAPENPEYLPELGEQHYADVEAYYDSTGDLSPELLAEAQAMAIARAREAGSVASGYIDSRAGSSAVATSAGLFAFHASTGVSSTLTVRKPDGSSSGWAGDAAADWNAIESERIAATAVRKCENWRGVTQLEAGRYDVVLEPAAVGMLMLRFMSSLNARSADEGRSYFSNPAGGTRIGERLFDDRITMISDPQAAGSETSPFTGQGIPRDRVTWIEHGTVRNLSYSRFWAQRQGVEPRPGPANLIMSGGDSSLEGMIASTERGVLITRFWYVRGLNPRIVSYTGLTRDGTFLIEGGRISRPVNNFRFNQSLAELLQNVESLGPAVQVSAGENASVGTPMVVPAMKVRGFNLASRSDAI